MPGRAPDFADLQGEHQQPFEEEDFKVEPADETFACTAASLHKLEQGESAVFNPLRPSVRRKVLFELNTAQTPSELPSRKATAALKRSLRNQQKADEQEKTKSAGGRRCAT